MTGRVVPVEWCRWCRQHVDAPHDCPYSPTTCPTDAGDPCGHCPACIASQEADPRYGPRNPDEETP